MLVTGAEGKSVLDAGSCAKRLTTIALRKQGVKGDVWQRRIHDRGLRSNFDGDLIRAVHYTLTDAGAPVARQMAMGSDQHATALLGVLLGSIERHN